MMIQVTSFKPTAQYTIFFLRYLISDLSFHTTKYIYYLEENQVKSSRVCKRMDDKQAIYICILGSQIALKSHGDGTEELLMNNC